MSSSILRLTTGGGKVLEIKCVTLSVALGRNHASAEKGLEKAKDRREAKGARAKRGFKPGWLTVKDRGPVERGGEIPDRQPGTDTGGTRENNKDRVSTAERTVTPVAPTAEGESAPADQPMFSVPKAQTRIPEFKLWQFRHMLASKAGQSINGKNRCR